MSVVLELVLLVVASVVVVGAGPEVVGASPVLGSSVGDPTLVAL
ncbi:hypothetical protein [Nannocystis punicea]|uniref:Uncharacterized protein n=1 Tax=Nannocystis punicea TaxID=2995304 RepID=A0ABY7HGB2_9BACT|nr:hypothetical protein [Nannocystis poenicansa]WAS98332.1 hypothetical protein O0S08_19500 [Nannocystis poenicansa]